LVETTTTGSLDEFVAIDASETQLCELCSDMEEFC